MKEWLSVKEAAFVVNRHPRNIYRWVEKGILRSRTDERGSTVVSSAEVCRVEAAVRRGRPQGTARPSGG
jgi:hypothetical protein